MRVIFQAEIDRTEEVMAIGVGGIDRYRMLEITKRHLLTTSVEVSKAQAVPHVCIHWIDCGGRLQSLLRLWKASKIQESNTFVEKWSSGACVDFVSLLKFEESLLGKLLVHESYANIIQPSRLDIEVSRFGGAECRGTENT